MNNLEKLLSKLKLSILNKIYDLLSQYPGIQLLGANVNFEKKELAKLKTNKSKFKSEKTKTTEYYYRLIVNFKISEDNFENIKLIKLDNELLTGDEFDDFILKTDIENIENQEDNFELGIEDKDF